MGHGHPVTLLRITFLHLWHSIKYFSSFFAYYFCNILLIFVAQIQKFSSHFTQYIISQFMQIGVEVLPVGLACFHICFGVLGVLLTAC